MNVRSDGEKFCYVGRDKCGCIVFAVADMPGHEKSTAEDVAEAIADGYIVERVTAQYTRDNFGCKCKGEQGTLL